MERELKVKFTTKPETPNKSFCYEGTQKDLWHKCNQAVWDKLQGKFPCVIVVDKQTDDKVEEITIVGSEEKTQKVVIKDKKPTMETGRDKIIIEDALYTTISVYEDLKNKYPHSKQLNDKCDESIEEIELLLKKY